MPDIAGLKLIVPTSATATGGSSSITVSATGKVTFTSCVTFSINGCFSSTYDNYLIVIRSSASSDCGVDLRLRASGTDNSTSNSYVLQYLQASSTVVAGGRLTGSLANDFYAGYSAQRDGGHLYLYGPYLAQPTAGRSVNVFGYLSAAFLDNAFTHNQSTSYDGFTLLTDSTQTLTGALTIYGLSQ